jgi:hypothetical protein
MGQVRNVSTLSPARPYRPLFHPTVGNQTVFFLATHNQLVAAGSFAPIPYLAGNNDNEAGYYRESAFSQNKTLTDAQ